jgi:chaperonin cofactor prefoldin
MGKLKRELSKELEHLKEAYDQLAQHFDEINTERLALIDELDEMRLKENKIVYIKDATGIHCNDGELVVEHSKGDMLIWEVKSLLEDLPFIVTQVAKEVRKEVEENIKMLKENISEL